jgi:hypothetical protein
MKKLGVIVMAMAGLMVSSNAEVIYLDLGGVATGGTGTEAYNVISSPGSGTGHALSTAGGGLSFSALQDTDGVATTVGGSLTTYNTSTTKGTAAGETTNAAYIHDPVVGINVSATGDAFWVNDQGDGSGGFGFVFSFTGLTGEAYDITLLGGSSNAQGTWSVTTGTGDSDALAYTSASSENILDWTSVAPVDGSIVLTSIGTTAGGWKNASVSFVSLEAVPEPATLGMVVAMGGGLLWIRRVFMV